MIGYRATTDTGLHEPNGITDWVGDKSNFRRLRSGGGGGGTGGREPGRIGGGRGTGGGREKGGKGEI